MDQDLFVVKFNRQPVGSRKPPEILAMIIIIRE
jgi:hypothetical protein